MKPVHALTVRGKGRLARLVTTVRLRAYIDGAPSQLGPFIEFNALWDTGASGSVVTERVATACGLKPITMRKVYHAQGEGLAEVYLINLKIHDAVEFERVEVTRGILKGIDVLIGMDIITWGDFAITNKDQVTTFSFRIPSRSTIDYVKEHNAQMAVPKYVHARDGKGRGKRKRR